MFQNKEMVAMLVYQTRDVANFFNGWNLLVNRWLISAGGQIKRAAGTFPLGGWKIVKI